MKRSRYTLLALFCVVMLHGVDRASMIQRVKQILEESYDPTLDLLPRNEAQALVEIIFGEDPIERCKLLSDYAKAPKPFIEEYRQTVFIDGSRYDKSFMRNYTKRKKKP